MGKPVPNMPLRCRKVYDALLAAKKPMREIDLINATGQSCAGVKLRELRRLNPKEVDMDYDYFIGDRLLTIIPPLVITRHCRSEDGRRAWAEHRLSRSWKVV